VLSTLGIAPRLDYAHAEASVALAQSAGITVLAGTDANTEPLVPARPPYGESLHDELELLVAAGLSPAEALRSATTAPARVFGLTDRGSVTPGLRADLVLTEGDPTQDITATRNIRETWIGGTQHRSSG
jgi:imidazolonepropionase-like amidohydrolase